MSSYLTHRDEATVQVSEATVEDGVTYYTVRVTVGPRAWTVRRRFRDFVDLHEKLTSDYGIPKDKLPPKKILGNKSSKFIEQRREALNEYTSWTLNHLRSATPPVWVRFLDLHKYDIFFVLQSLAETLYKEGDSILHSGEPFKCTPLELHAVSERVKIPCPPTEKLHRAYDFSHILDFCGQLTSLQVEGCYEPLGTSNIVPNELSFDLAVFKSLAELTLLGVPLDRITGVGTLRDTLTSVSVLVTGAESLDQFLLVDIVHKEADSVADTVRWRRLQSINFGSNRVARVDWAVGLVPRLERLSLGSNRLQDMPDLSRLHHLTSLDLSLNRFGICEGWHEKLGNVRSIDLSQNQIEHLKGFGRLYSLESLNLSCNLISDIEEVQHICRLPCLEQVWLTANPVASGIDYRVRVLEQFAARAQHVTLDSEPASEKELDKARVLQALRIVKEGKTPHFLDTSNSVNYNSS